MYTYSNLKVNALHRDACLLNKTLKKENKDKNISGDDVLNVQDRMKYCDATK